MKRFQCIIDGARSPVQFSDRFPPPPTSAEVTSEEELGRWRVQALLMSAEVRYSLYLRFLRDWVNDFPEQRADKSSWPLPPWYVGPPGLAKSLKH